MPQPSYVADALQVPDLKLYIRLGKELRLQQLSERFAPIKKHYEQQLGGGLIAPVKTFHMAKEIFPSEYTKNTAEFVDELVAVLQNYPELLPEGAEPENAVKKQANEVLEKLKDALVEGCELERKTKQHAFSKLELYRCECDDGNGIIVFVSGDMAELDKEKKNIEAIVAVYAMIYKKKERTLCFGCGHKDEIKSGMKKKFLEEMATDQFGDSLLSLLEKYALFQE